MSRYVKIVLCLVVILCSSWGFFAHKKINQLAVFTLPSSMAAFYKKNIDYLSEAAVNPDRRRYALVDEAPRHYIDLDVYGDSAAWKLPTYWDDAVEKIGEDSLVKHGIAPWNLFRVYNQLKDAFMIRDPEKILRLSADLGHYVGDIHVPLHTTSNYDGQKTNQVGIHGFWESRLPELFSSDYNFFVGKARYINHVQQEIWQAIRLSNSKVDSVLFLERKLSELSDGNKFSFESKGKQTVKVYAATYAQKYHELLNGMVERQFRASIKMTGSLWYTAWVEAGQPDLKALINYLPTEEELERRKQELILWKERRYLSRDHESNDN